MTDQRAMPAAMNENPGAMGGIIGAPTSITAFVGRTPTGPSDTPAEVSSFGDFQHLYGGLAAGFPLTYAVQDFFLNGGSEAIICRLGAGAEALTSIDYLGDHDNKPGLYMLDQVALFNLLCIPPDTRDGEIGITVISAAAQYCATRGAMLIVDPPAAWTVSAQQQDWAALDPSKVLAGENARAAAIYFPRIVKEDLLNQDALAAFPPCGAIAGVFATTDAQVGVWKAPAGIQSGLSGIAGLEVTLSDSENGTLNSTGINCLRTFPNIGPVVWGARTMRGADAFADDYKYIPVYRLASYIRQSITASTRWTLFESNGPQLWSALRSSIDAFMAALLNQGAFYSYTLICDATTTTPADIEQGVVNITVMFAPIRPDEFLVISIQLPTAEST